MRKGTGFVVLAVLFLVMLAPASTEAGVVIEFQQGSITGSDITFSDGGTQAHVRVPISMMTVSGAGNKDGTYDLQGPLGSGSDTYAGLEFATQGRMELWGYIPSLDLYGTGGTNGLNILLTGMQTAFQNVSIQTTGLHFTITGSGIDYKNPDLLTALGLGTLSGQGWDFSLSMNGETLIAANGYRLTDTVLTNTHASPVPVPAAVWLLGSGLVGLIGIRRYRK